MQKVVPISAIKIPEIRSSAVFDTSKLDELKQSIEDNGIQFRPLVRPQDFETYELIDGLHRIKVWKELGHDDIEVEIEQLNDDQADIKHIVANHHRGNSDPIGLSMVINKLLKGGKTVNQIAKMIGYHAATVDAYVPLALLPDEFKKSLTEGILNLSHVREIQRLADPADMAAGLTLTINNRWSASTLKHWIDNRIGELQIMEVKRKTGHVDAIAPPPPRAELADIRQCLVCGAQGKNQDMHYPCLGPECYDTLQYLISIDKSPWRAVENITAQLQQVQDDNAAKDKKIRELGDKIVDISSHFLTEKLNQ